MPSVSRYRTWLAVPADEIEDLKKAHPPMNGHTPVLWDKEHKLWFARPGADLSMLDRWLPRPQEVSMNGSDPVTEFAQVLENAGLVLKELPVMDGKIHRVPTAGTQNIRAQFVHHILRRNGVADGFRHLATLTIHGKAVGQYLTIRRFAFHRGGDHQGRHEPTTVLVRTFSRLYSRCVIKRRCH